MRIARFCRKPRDKAAPCQRAPGAGRKRPALFRWAALVALALALAPLAAFAAMRSSASYAMSLDTIAAGGGPSSSASYRQLDSSFGEEAQGSSGSAGYRGQAGVVMPWGPAMSGISDWRLY